MITGRNILCISSIDWDFIWQGHQEIMSRLAAHGNRVLFVENTGVRPPTIRDLPRLRKRLRNWRRGTKGFREERPNLFVYSPVVLPLPYSRVARWVNRGVLVRAINRWMRAAEFHSPIVWTFLPTPLSVSVIEGVDASLVIYYCIDDFASSSHAARKSRKTEEQIFRDADLVFVTSEKLRERAAKIASQVHLFPFGVDFESFERVRTADDQVPPELRALRRPVIGYVGGLHQFVDQSLVCAVADAMPDASIALVGPEQADVSVLRRRPNVYLLGAREHADVPRFVKGFDVGIVPYRLSDYTEHVYPTKLNEYLAMGVPVVATDLFEIRRFAGRHEDVVSVAAETGTFVEAVRRVAVERDAAAVARRVAVARENGWSSRLEAMSSLIEAALGERRARAGQWDETLRQLYRRARQRSLQAAFAVILAYGVLFHTPAIWWAAEWLRVAEAPQPADAIVVFGGGVGEVAYDDTGYQERVYQAVDLYRAGFADTVVFSSGHVSTYTEPQVMRALAVSQGVPESAIVLEAKASSTRENVLFTREIVQPLGVRRVLLVSAPYHMRRAMLTWKKLAPGIDAIAAPVPRSRFYRRDGSTTLSQVVGILYEYAAVVYYVVRGWM